MARKWCSSLLEMTIGHYTAQKELRGTCNAHGVCEMPFWACPRNAFVSGGNPEGGQA